MLEYIDRSELLKRLKVTPLLELGIPLHVKEGVLDLVSKEPAADTEPVRHGRWVDVENPLTWCEDDVEICSYCSLCGAENALGETEFCPNCGAKMDGGER